MGNTIMLTAEKPQKSWHTLVFNTSKNLTDLISDFLLNIGAVSISLEDAKSQALFEMTPNQQLLWDQVQLTAYFEEAANLNEICQKLKEVMDNPQLVIKTNTFCDEDWLAKVKSLFKPKNYGKLWVYPSWEKPEAEKNPVIYIDPGQAFGTGSHQTTSLCLDWLAKQSLEKKSLLDFGCGSGILGIAALKLGCKTTNFVDNDPLALTITQENCQRNEIQIPASIMQPNELPQTTYDIVIANILAQTLITLSQQLTDHVKPGGTLVLSGILTEQVEAIDQTFLDHFSARNIIQNDEWVLWSATKSK